jgi:hypothetical protein
MIGLREKLIVFRGKLKLRKGKIEENKIYSFPTELAFGRRQC